MEGFGPVRITRMSRSGHTTKANEASEDLRSLGRGRWASLYFLRSVGKECFGEPPKLKREPACAPQMLLWCEGGDDLFEARVAAQWIPKRHQFQLTISDWAWRAGDHGQLLASEIFVADPGRNHRQILDHRRTSERIFFHGQKLNRAPPFAQRFFFAAQSGID